MGAKYLGNRFQENFKLGWLFQRWSYNIKKCFLSYVLCILSKYFLPRLFFVQYLLSEYVLIEILIKSITIS